MFVGRWVNPKLLLVRSNKLSRFTAAWGFARWTQPLDGWNLMWLACFTHALTRPCEACRNDPATGYSWKGVHDDLEAQQFPFGELSRLVV